MAALFRSLYVKLIVVAALAALTGRLVLHFFRHDTKSAQTRNSTTIENIATKASTTRLPASMSKTGITTETSTAHQPATMAKTGIATEAPPVHQPATVSHTTTNRKDSLNHTRSRDSFKYILDNYKFCRTNTIHEAVVLVLVASKSTHFRQRIAIRGTWGLAAVDHGFRLAFLLGRPAAQSIQELIFLEDDRFYDIIQGDFLDTGMNETLKSVMMLHWVSYLCSSANFVLKVTDDVFLNPWGLWSDVQTSLKNSRRTMWGLMHDKGVRNTSRNRNISHDKDDTTLHPPFLDGTAYLFTADSAEILYNMSADVPPVPEEDVYVTGILAKKAGIRIIHHPGFTLEPGLFLPCGTPRTITRLVPEPLTLMKLWRYVPITSKDFRCDTERRTQNITKNGKNVSGRKSV